MPNIVSKALDVYATSNIKPFLSDRMSTVGASEIGQCIRKVFWLKNEDDAQLHRVPRDDEYTDDLGRARCAARCSRSNCGCRRCASGSASD